jgi:ribosome assembly protein 1
MESSAISLYFSLTRRSSPEAQPTSHEYLINLIDSPGHIDFSSEVSTASRLCDGAVVLVDAVEGVLSQTITVLRQCWIEKLKPLLVVNKMDRLITELKMSPGEAYTHLNQLLEQVNAVMGSFFMGDRMEDDLKWREKVEERVKAASARLQEKVDGTSGIKEDAEGVDATSTPAEHEEKDDEDIYLAPEKNNVIFSSAIDGWAFTVKQFAGLYEKKLGIKRSVLEKVLWGDFYLDPKTKRVLASKHLKGRNLKPMFVQLVLEPLWAVYEATTVGNNGKGDPAMIEKITKSLSITVPPHILRSKDPRAWLTTLFAAWLPLSTALLVSVIEHLPSPRSSQATRMPDLLDNSPGAESIDPNVRNAMINFRTDRDAPIVAYISKMVSVPESELPQNKRRGGSTLSSEEARELARKKRAEFAKARTIENDMSDNVGFLANTLNATSIDDKDQDFVEQVKEDPEHLIGFARLYSGTLNVDDEVYVLPPKWSPAHSHAPPEPQKVRIQQLYLLMGRSMETLDSVPAGVVFGVEGLAGHVFKSGTLCSQLEGGVNLAGVSLGSQPIVRVALEPEHPIDLDKMIRGLKMLEQSDPCAIYEVLESGEHVLATAGELHLERCLKDLKDRFARCELQVGEPIVPYRESIVSAPEMNPPRDKELPRGTVIVDVSSKQVQIRTKVRPLPASVTEFLTKNAVSIKKLYAERRAEEEAEQKQEVDIRSDLASEKEDLGDIGISEATETLSLTEFKSQLQETFAEAKSEKEIWNGIVEKIAAFGPRRTGPNILIDATNSDTFSRILQEHRSETSREECANEIIIPRDFSDKIIYAFQLATLQGPLCNEPVQGVAVFLEFVTISNLSDEQCSAPEKLGRLTGEVIRTVKESIRLGFLDWSPRILLAMYSCEIQCSTEVLGRVYGVITRRRGRILSESMKEGTPFFSILALLPVAESFGFAAEIRQRTGGLASPQLRFEGFEALDEDPFWVPWTEEELEDLGETADRENVAKRYVDKVRKRKGLFVSDKRAATNAEKQKTLKR